MARFLFLILLFLKFFSQVSCPVSTSLVGKLVSPGFPSKSPVLYRWSVCQVFLHPAAATPSQAEHSLLILKVVIDAAGASISLLAGAGGKVAKAEISRLCVG